MVQLVDAVGRFNKISTLFFRVKICHSSASNLDIRWGMSCSRGNRIPRQLDNDNVPPQDSVITRPGSVVSYRAGTEAHRPCSAPCTILPSNLWREELFIV